MLRKFYTVLAMNADWLRVSLRVTYNTNNAAFLVIASEVLNGQTTKTRQSIIAVNFHSKLMQASLFICQFFKSHVTLYIAV